MIAPPKTQIINLWFEGCPSDALLTNLDLAGIAAAAGSACTAGSLEPSHVLAAMYGKDQARVSQSLRFSFGRYNTAAEIDELVAQLTLDLANVLVEIYHL